MHRKPNHEKNDFYMYDKPRSSMECTVVSFENNPQVRNHIIVCGVHSSIRSFIRPLRVKCLAEYQIQKIVIITGDPDERGGDQLNPQIWNSISKFVEVYLVNGSPLK